MMIQAVLGNPHHPEYGVATIPFPIPRDQYTYCMDLLEALEIGDAVKADCKVEEVDMPVIPPALRIDSKRRRRLQEKRMAMGHKRNDHEDEQLHHVNDNTMR